MSAFGWHIREFSAPSPHALGAIFGEVGSRGPCRKKGCGKPSECYVAYRYITGRAGRVSTSEKPYCREHALAIVAAKTGAPT